MRALRKISFANENKRQKCTLNLLVYRNGFHFKEVLIWTLIIKIVKKMRARKITREVRR